MSSWYVRYSTYSERWHQDSNFTPQSLFQITAAIPHVHIHVRNTMKNEREKGCVVFKGFFFFHLIFMNSSPPDTII